MKRILFLILTLALGAVLRAGDALADDPGALRKEMARIRRSTNWDDPVERETTRLKIEELSIRLAKALHKPAAGAPPGSAPTAAPGDPPADDEDPTMKIFISGLRSASASGGADIRLDTMIRDEMEQRLRADQDNSIKNPEVLEVLDTLVLDLSLPETQAIIRQMEQFKSIHTLIITGGAHGAPVDLPSILLKARGYPLRELYVINFRQNVTALPSEAGGFADLRVLAVFDNAIAALPSGIGGLQNLETLFVDANPLATVLPVVRALPKLTKLGVGKTGVPAAELDEIRRLLPNCQLLTQ